MTKNRFNTRSFILFRIGYSAIALLLLGAFLVVADGFVAPNELQEFVPKYTGIQREIVWESATKPIPIQKELALFKSGVLFRGEFSKLNDERLLEVEQKCRDLGMTLDQGLLIRKQLQVTHTMRNTWKLKKYFDSIKGKFCKESRTLLQLSRDLGLPPVNILREIVKERVFQEHPDMEIKDRNKIVKQVIREDNKALVSKFLTDWELDQLQVAKEVDIVGYESQPAGMEIESEKWEKAIYKFLSDNKINFLTEEDMRAANSRITPDCLLLDDCVINGRKVRWIDAKNYYGSGLRESNGISKKISKQIEKYNAEFGGDGAIVFKNGFSQKYLRNFPSALFLDAGPLKLPP